MRDLEPIYSALFALAQSANTAQTPFAKMSRRWRSWGQMSAEESPALYQLQKPIRVEGGDRPLPLFRLQVEWYAYFSSDNGDLETPMATTLNSYLTAIIGAIQAPIRGQQQTLGGLVQSVYVDGDIVMDEGVISPPAVLCIPITILTGF